MTLKQCAVSIRFKAMVILVLAFFVTTPVVMAVCSAIMEPSLEIDEATPCHHNLQINGDDARDQDQHEKEWSCCDTMLDAVNPMTLSWAKSLQIVHSEFLMSLLTALTFQNSWRDLIPRERQFLALPLESSFTLVSQKIRLTV